MRGDSVFFLWVELLFWKKIPAFLEKFGFLDGVGFAMGELVAAMCHFADLTRRRLQPYGWVVKLHGCRS